jgi:hypothetical protein
MYTGGDLAECGGAVLAMPEPVEAFREALRARNRLAVAIPAWPV